MRFDAHALQFLEIELISSLCAGPRLAKQPEAECIDLTEDNDLVPDPAPSVPADRAVSSSDELDMLPLNQRLGIHAATGKQSGISSAVVASRPGVNASQRDLKQTTIRVSAADKYEQLVDLRVMNNRGGGNRWPVCPIVSDAPAGFTAEAHPTRHVSANFTGFSHEAGRESSLPVHANLITHQASRAHTCDLFAQAEAARQVTTTVNGRP